METRTEKVNIVVFDEAKKIIDIVLKTLPPEQFKVVLAKTLESAVSALRTSQYHVLFTEYSPNYESNTLKLRELLTASDIMKPELIYVVDHSYHSNVELWHMWEDDVERFIESYGFERFLEKEFVSELCRKIKGGVVMFDGEIGEFDECEEGFYKRLFGGR